LQKVSTPVKDYGKCTIPDQKESSRCAEEQKSGCLGEVWLKEGGTVERLCGSLEGNAITHSTQIIDRHRIHPMVPNTPQFITATTESVHCGAPVYLKVFLR
jgi:hypothetical protein